MHTHTTKKKVLAGQAKAKPKSGSRAGPKSGAKPQTLNLLIAGKDFPEKVKTIRSRLIFCSLFLLLRPGGQERADGPELCAP